jgi:ubiquinone/menaquinone biosynthesis C-methylase UbiE
MTIEELHKRLGQPEPIIIELGCGPQKIAGAIGIDRISLAGVDIVADLEQGLSFLPDNSVDEVHSRHFIEHVDSFEKLMREVHRVLKPNGKHFVTVPHFSNPYFYSDSTHRRFFGLYSFDYFSQPETQLRRKVPSYYVDFHFQIVHRKLIFKSVFPIRNLLKQIVQRLANISPYFQELYEEFFCYRFPCQEIYFMMLSQK